MTLQPSDSPDWTGIAGGMRYLGSIALAGNGVQAGTLAFTPTSYDGAVYLMAINDPVAGGGFSSVTVTELGTGLATFGPAALSPADPPSVAFVARVLGASWRVSASVSWPLVGGPFTATLYVFAIPAYPGVSLNQPVNPFPVSLQAVGAVYLPAGPRQPYDSMQFSAPGAGVGAAVTFAATFGKRWVVDLATWQVRSAAGVAQASTARIMDGVNQRYSMVCSATAVAGAIDTREVGPGAGYVGAVNTAMVVDFGAAPAAANFQSISAAAYLIT